MWRKFIADEKAYQIDFTRELVGGDAITNIVSVSADNGIVADRPTFTGAVVTLWLSGGTTLGYGAVTCIVDTAAGETLEAQPVIQLLA